MSLCLSLFGSPAVRDGAGSSALSFERRGQLLAYLALRRTWVGRAEIAALLWPEQENKLAFTNLRKTLFRLQALPWASRLELQGNAARFVVETDVAAFESALAEGRLADALAAYGGELLAGFEDPGNDTWTGWLGFERDRLRSAWRGAALARLGSALEAGEALALAARLLEADGLDEAAVQAQMTWLARTGQGARARHVYRQFAERVHGELGVAPGPELTALHDSLATGAPTATTATEPRPVESAPRAPGDGFVGRSVELRRIADLLAQPDCRLLCLTGPGGIGKTRLARQAQRELAASYADGAVFVALEDVVETSELGERLARELGIVLGGRREPMEQVSDFLRSKQMLLVLDNFEQLAAAAGEIERLLERNDALKCLVTSRLRLGTPREWLLPVEGLPCPEPEDQDRIEAFDAARVFINAARRFQPALDAAREAGAIVDICRQVEGMPLALELAAAWTRVLSCAAIAADLRAGTELLRAVDATRPARHASIEIAFEQSWKMLSPRERDALARLSLFRGGFTAEAARFVAEASLPVLGSLADKSLLRKDGARLAMHPLVQQLAAMRLGDGTARASAEHAFAGYFHRLLAQLAPAVETGVRAALDQVETEFENCSSAWRWSIANAAAGNLVRSASTLMHFCDHRGHSRTGASLLSEAFAMPEATQEPYVRAAVAHLKFRMDLYGESEALAAQALAAAQRRRDHVTQTLCNSVLGACSLRRGPAGEAGSYFEKAMKHAVAAGLARRAAALEHNLALVERAAGRRAQAQRLLQDSMARYRALGDSSGEALCLTTLATLFWDAEELGVAIEHMKAALVICDRHGLDRTRTIALANLAALAFKTGDFEAAAGYAARAREAAQRSNNLHFQCWMCVVAAQLALQRQELATARVELKSALEIALPVGQTSVLLEGASCFAELLAAQGERIAACRVMAFIEAHPAMSAPDRAPARARLAQWGGDAGTLGPWPGFSLEELARRIVLESETGHAALTAVLRAGTGATPDATRDAVADRASVGPPALRSTAATRRAPGSR